MQQLKPRINSPKLSKGENIICTFLSPNYILKNHKIQNKISWGCQESILLCCQDIVIGYIQHFPHFVCLNYYCLFFFVFVLVSYQEMVHTTNEKNKKQKIKFGDFWNKILHFCFRRVNTQPVTNSWDIIYYKNFVA